MNRRVFIDPIYREEADLSLHEIDKCYWPQIEAMKVPTYIPLSVPVPPQSPHRLLQLIQNYAKKLFDTEAELYDQIRENPAYRSWLQEIATETTDRILGAIERIEGEGKDSTLWHHGIGQHEIETALHEETVSCIVSRTTNETKVNIEAQMPSSIHFHAANADLPAQRRMALTVNSPSAVRRMESYISTKGIGLTDFAGTVGITDRTLRNFRKTGKIRRDIFDRIAKAMETSKNDLLKP